MNKPQINKKHMVYAEDILWEIMQYPSRNLTKGLVKQLIEKVMDEKEIPARNVSYVRSSDDDEGDIYD